MIGGRCGEYGGNNEENDIYDSKDMVDAMRMVAQMIKSVAEMRMTVSGKG